MGAVNEWVVGGGWSRRLSLDAECNQIGRARQRRGCAGQQGGERLGGKADGLVDGAQGEVSSLLGQRGADMSGGMGGRRGESLGGRPNVVCARHLGQRREKISRKKNRKRSAMEAGRRFGWRFLGLDASLARSPQPDWSKHKQSLHPPVNPPLWVRLRGNPRPLANQEIQSVQRG